MEKKVSNIAFERTRRSSLPYGRAKRKVIYIGTEKYNYYIDGRIDDDTHNSDNDCLERIQRNGILHIEEQ
jgi:hypothetical protein